MLQSSYSELDIRSNVLTVQNTSISPIVRPVSFSPLVTWLSSWLVCSFVCQSVSDSVSCHLVRQLASWKFNFLAGWLADAAIMDS